MGIRRISYRLHLAIHHELHHGDILAMPVFVFGSNEAGRHGAGAALEARRHHGAIYGQGFGRQGNSFAIPTKDMKIQPLPLAAIAEYVARFIRYASEHPDEVFKVTRIGCGLASYTNGDIKPMFRNATTNCDLPEEWQ